MRNVQPNPTPGIERGNLNRIRCLHQVILKVDSVTPQYNTPGCDVLSNMFNTLVCTLKSAEVLMYENINNETQDAFDTYVESVEVEPQVKPDIYSTIGRLSYINSMIETLEFSDFSCSDIQKAPVIKGILSEIKKSLVSYIKIMNTYCLSLLNDMEKE